MAIIRGGSGLSKKLADITAALASARVVRCGFLENSDYPDGTKVAMVAALNEYGHRTLSTQHLMFTQYGQDVPPRPFFRSMIAAKSPTWGKVVAASLKASDFQANVALKLVGEQVSGDLRLSIQQTNSPPLKPATIKRKGSDKVLVDTGHMLQSVDYEVT